VGEQAVVVVAGGERAPTPPVLPAGALVIGADSGVDYALALGLHVDVAVGDFDSVSTGGLERVEREGARVERHPADKDKTDLELALDEAVRAGATEIIVVGVGGGRLDHYMANLLLLASPKYAACRVVAFDGPVRVHVVHAGRTPTALPGEVGELLTLLPVAGDAVGVVTRGLRYPLKSEALGAGTSRGVSNVIEATDASVQLDAGALLAIFPGQGELHA
jgi:thiamine pyrophosphokinase